MAQTSSGEAEYSVLGSLASSRASCIMRLTAMWYDRSSTAERTKKFAWTIGPPELFLLSKRGTAAICAKRGL